MMDALKQIKSDIPITAMAKKLGYDILDRGGKVNINCPFCDDTKQHMVLYTSSSRYFCHKCRAAGDAIDLAIKGHKCTIQDVKSLFGYTDNPTPKQAHQSANSKPFEQPQSSETKQAQPETRDFSYMYFDIMANMELTQAGRDYLYHRGLSDSIINRYDLRSIDDPKTTAQNLLKRYSLQTLIEAGLYDYSKNNKPYFAFFMPAIVFPHFDMEATRITYLSTRNLSGDVKSFKLHNVPSRLYYGDIQNSPSIYVFEGIISALSFAQLTGKDNFVALNGLITPAKHEKLRDMMPNQKVILALDPDEAGKKALAEIEKPLWMDWRDIAEQITGSRELPTHANGKAFDANDYLMLMQSKER